MAGVERFHRALGRRLRSNELASQAPCRSPRRRFAASHACNEATFDISKQIIHKQLTIIGSWVFSIPMMMELVDLVSRHGLPLGETLITDRHQLKDAPAAFERFCAGDTSGKGVFVWS